MADSLYISLRVDPRLCSSPAHKSPSSPTPTSSLITIIRQPFTSINLCLPLTKYDIYNPDPPLI